MTKSVVNNMSTTSQSAVQSSINFHPIYHVIPLII